MRKKIINTLLIFTGTAALMVVILIAVIKIYDMILRETQKSHQLQQMEMAKAAALGISTHLDHLVEDMHLLTFLPEMQSLQRKVIQTNVDFIFKHYDEEAISAIFVTDSDINLIYLKGEPLPAWALPLMKRGKEQINIPTSLHRCWYSPVHPLFEEEPESGMLFLMVIPLKRKNSTAQTNGYVGYLLNFNMLIRYFIEPLKLSKNDFAWILDGSGRLIFHPRHTEMLMRTPTDSTADCMECHSSFEVQKRMIAGEASMDEYTIGEEPPKIMAYVPIDLQNEKWILAISTLLPEVTENLRSKFRLFFILGVLILAAIFSLGYALYYINSKRIRAEEAKRQSEQLQQLQQQLNHTSKLASIGELVDTVAHEINTPAGIISAQADALLLQETLQDKNLDEINIIKQQTRRISKYTRTLLGYSKRVPFDPRPINVVELIEECIYLLGHRFRAQKVTVIKNYTRNLPRVLLDRGQMEQVFINLLNNALDAINDYGKITISAGTAYRKVALDEPGTIAGIVVEIADNGRGIQEADIKQIFEPFFSTKLPSEGTGLGLYISRSIIQRHHGTIEVSSVVNQGTAFSIFLPLNLKGMDES